MNAFEIVLTLTIVGIFAFVIKQITAKKKTKKSNTSGGSTGGGSNNGGGADVINESGHPEYDDAGFLIKPEHGDTQNHHVK